MNYTASSFPGNAPLVAILREALARDRVRHDKEQGRKLRKGEAMSEVKAFIQNIHHFRDECLIDQAPPIEHVALFDEPNALENLQQTSNFMARKRILRTSISRAGVSYLLSQYGTAIGP